MLSFNTAIFYTKNMSAAVDFYVKTIGLTPVQGGSDYYTAFQFENQAMLGLKFADKEGQVPGMQTVILTVDDIDALNADLKKKNVQFHSELTDFPWGRHFSIRDVDNNKVEFVQQ